MLTGTLVAALAIFLSIIYWITRLDRNRKLFSRVPGPPALPIIGNALQLSRDGPEFFEQILKYSEKYGPVWRLMIGTNPFLFISSPEAIELVIRSTKNLSKGDTYKFLHPWLKLGLLTSTGAKWKSRRRLLTPAFHFRILSDFMHVFNGQVDVMTNRLDAVCGQGEIDTFPYITLCALDIICETAMGRKVNAQISGGDSDYVKAVYKISDILMRRVRSPWLQPDLLFNMTQDGSDHAQCLKILHGFTRKVIEERQREMKESPEQFNIEEGTEDSDRHTRKKKMAFLDLLLSMADESGLTLDDIQEEVDTFMFEGHDTTAAAMNWTVHLIGKHPEVQEKLHQEVDRVFGDSDRHATMDDIRQLKYLENVIKESLRILPSVPSFARMLDEDTMIDGHNIPAGTTISIWTAAMHRNPDLYPDPLKFDPNRFDTEESTKRHPFAYLPFSAGPRNCIGQKFALSEEKVVLSAIIRRYHIESTQAWEDLKPDIALILRPADGIKVKLTRRQRNIPT